MTTTSPDPRTDAHAGPAGTPTTPTDRLLTASMLVAPLVYLAADSLYAARGWDDPAGGVLHVLGAIGYGFVVLRVSLWLPRSSVLAAVLLLVGLVGLAGNVAYGFDAIHQSLGDVPLVDRDGAGVLIKPLGLFFPLALLLVGAALLSLGRRWQAALVVVAGVAWPVAHIANVAPVAVAVNVVLVVALGSLVWRSQPS